MKALFRLGRKFGFTRNETLVILFLSAMAASGGIVRMVSPPPLRFDYTEAYRIHDSVFAARADAEAAGMKPASAPLESYNANPGGESRPARRQEPLRLKPFDLNRAGARQLESLPGIGPAIASRIIDYRDRNGAFASVDDLMKVPGIGPKTCERIKPYLRISE